MSFKGYSKSNSGNGFISEDDIDFKEEKIKRSKLSLVNGNKWSEKMDTESESDNCETKQQFVYTIDNKVLCIMRPNTKFHFIGKLKIYALYGSIEIFGYNYDAFSKPIEAYSPKSHSFISIKSISATNKNVYNLQKVQDYLSNEGIDLEIQSSLVNFLQECAEGWTILLLENFENTLTTFLNKFCPIRLFPKIEHSNSIAWDDLSRAEATLQSHLRLNGDEGQEVIMSSKWKNDFALNFVKKDLTHDSRSRCILFGGKGVGKSTAVRYLINQSLPLTQNKKIILMDLDPGQAECTPAGSISLTVIDKPLLGPNFTHLRTPYYEICLGEIDIGQCIPNYINGVMKLLDVLNTDDNLKGFSVIVNTMGFCKGPGEEIACTIIKLIQPTDVIQLISSSSANNFECYFNDKYVMKKSVRWMNSNLSKDKLSQNHDNLKLSYDFATICSNVQRFADNRKIKLTPFQHREIVLFSYLSKITKQIKNALYDESLLSINNVTPYSVSFSSIYVSLTRTAVPSTHVLSVINGNVVGLCGVDVEQVQNDVDKITEGVKVFIRPPLAICYGHGIVRGIDVENKLIFINTPLKLDVLKRVNCLVGCTSTPKELLELDERDNPYIGGNDNLPTSRQTRRGFFQPSAFKSAVSN